MQLTLLTVLLLFPAPVDGFSPCLRGSLRDLAICHVSKEALKPESTHHQWLVDGQGSPETAHSQYVHIEETDWVEAAFNKEEGLGESIVPQLYSKIPMQKADGFLNAMEDFVPGQVETPQELSIKDMTHHEWFSTALDDVPFSPVARTNKVLDPNRHEWFSQAMKDFVPPGSSKTTSNQQKHTDWFTEAMMNYKPPQEHRHNDNPKGGLNEWFSQALGKN